jgi:TetR/AcrR family transcriptional repressor of mexCD-oprJ operon
MDSVTRGGALRDRVSTAILNSAASVFAERGDGASMDEIAEAAGVARATLYRYFPNREALIHAIVDAALEEISARVAEAQFETAPIDEALARLIRAIVATGSRYSVLITTEHMKHPDVKACFDDVIGKPLRQLFRRGITEGSLRGDLSEDVMLEMFGSLMKSAVTLHVRGKLGVEQAAAATTSVFMGGVRGQG